MTKKIAIIDDDMLPMRYYATALTLDGYDVDCINNISAAYDILFHSSGVKIDLLIIDIMMDPMTVYKADLCEDGLLTGLFLARDIRKQYPSLPIILFSNANITSVILKARRLADRLSRCVYLLKLDYPPAKLVQFINEYFKKGRFTTGLLKKFLDSIILQPNIQGIGIDLKELTKSKDKM